MRVEVILQIVAGLLPVLMHLLLSLSLDGNQLTGSQAAAVTAAANAMGRIAEIVDVHPHSFRMYPSPWWVEPHPTDLYCQFVLEHWNEETFRANFCMERSSFQDLCEALRPQLARQDTRMRQATPVEQQVVMAMFHLAQGRNYRVVENCFAVARPYSLVLTS
ncbi:hypothetical protein VOLCADRAFT_88796 [Volvox carteri f. nagariensis]|uniref:DUF8040 domain-containing protein n=1 Tax=Volvox carteri f. nagariensis TaxID=3068 RepID=D8TPZ2_VOLCA|nr:uncharacterized protein VOLCADRAFT_88796 [Volvox carteri f. nagariensis]EFJ50313.1 hypothetical protein VOLCADRAFT_88796 [Volvox carteri f. nagariensis]|eukprot:XP_002948438.1 hypothetical protein VOLCADRAFT_88796 [Volvox carteri f. nagariensis]